MSYLNQALLGEDVDFGRRCRSALTEQSAVFINDTRPQFVALANALLTLEAAPTQSFLLMLASTPGLADAAATEEGIDSSKITDGQILSAVQAEYPTVAALYFNEDGTRKEQP